MRDKPKTGGFRELVLPGNEFKTCIAVNFPKNADFGGLETNHKIQTLFIYLFFTYPSTHELNVI